MQSKILSFVIALMLVALSLPGRASNAAPAAFTVPVAASFATTVAANRMNAVQLQGSDAEGTALVYATTSSPAHGSLSGLNTATGALIYTPIADYIGADSFTYTVTSGGETSTAGTVTLTVTNRKTRIIDSVDPSVTPGAKAVTFVLTQAATSPGGLIPKGASVSASVNSSGQFDISVYPSRSLQPAAYYQVWVSSINGGQTLHGVYDIPLSTTTINLAPYKVLDTNLAQQYTFASSAAVSSLTTAVASATTATLLGISPTNNALQKYNSTLGTFANSTITDTGSAVAVAANTTITGNLTTSGSVISENVALPAAARAMIAAGQLPYSTAYVKGYTAFFDANALDLADGAAVSSWPDLSGNNRHAVQATGSLQPTFHLSETFTNSTGSYVSASDTADYLTLPLPASSTKAFFVVVRNQAPFPTGYTLHLDANNWLSGIGTSGVRWGTYKTNLAATTTPVGYSSEYSVLCWKMNSASSISFYVNGAFVETYTPIDTALSTATSIKIGPGFGHLKQVGVLDYGRAMTDAEVLDHSGMLLGYNALNWEFEFIGRTSVDFDPVLASEGLIVRKRGVRGKRPLVFLNHQASQTERVFLDATEQRAVLTALVEAGYIVAISRQWTATAFENSWGNDDAITANADLYSYVVANYQVDTSRVAMVGFSMGGVSTMLAFPDGRIPNLKGAACFDCVLDLQHAYDNGFSTSINSAYSITGVAPHTYALKTAGHDPRLLANTSFTGKRFAFFANTDDSIVNFTQNTSDFQAQIASVATEETITTGTGGHLANIASNVSNLKAFLARCFA